MKLMSRPVAAATLAAALAMTATACSRNAESTVAADCKPAHTFSTINKGVLTVGLTEIPPFSYTKDGKPTGVDVDIASDFAKANCLNVKYEPVAYSSAVPSVQNNRIDLTIGDWYRTKARSEVVNLSAPLYLDELGVISTDGITSIQQLKGKKVGTIDGYLWVEDLRKLLGADLKVYPSSVELKQDVEVGRVDVGIDAYGTALYNFKDSKFKVTTVTPDPAVTATVEPAQTTLPYGKNNTELGKALDETISELHSSGRIVEILKNHGLPDSAAEVGEPRLIN
ncbi:ABC transporter substrate-binding protein [Arthrobacter sp. ISL-28]|uniref:substrate-binding periplasmic protein n=1 Tax=Arthrobacter sp. ISL-28 TaxID=2819108 RepID=UPI001BED205D|nr:transporter substrate-binding domain-containing protein [Arthrobacter sp. ISL-28]MBT2523084.1 amino acid ABC transporter substrate-binding protein [Arthrobacter sp. ISL-28]